MAIWEGTGGGGARLVVSDLKLAGLDLFNGGRGGAKFDKLMGLDICVGIGGAGRLGCLCFVRVDVNGFAGIEGAGLLGFNGGGGGGWGGEGTGIAPLVGPKLAISISSTCL
jgi:hypothetical protein